MSFDFVNELNNIANKSQKMRKEQKVEDYKQKFFEKEKECEELTSKLLYLQADNQNILRRTSLEITERVQRANENILVDLIPILTHFKYALETMSNVPVYYDGVKMIENEFIKTLEQHGATRISPISLKDKYDPYYHEVIQMIDDIQLEPSIVYECIQDGWMVGNKVVVPAKVIVVS